jgi:hypothetical protein
MTSGRRSDVTVNWLPQFAAKPTASRLAGVLGIEFVGLGLRHVVEMISMNALARSEDVWASLESIGVTIPTSRPR